MKKILAILCILLASLSGCATHQDDHSHENVLDVDARIQVKESPTAGIPSHFEVEIKDSSGQPLELQAEHERLVHAVIVSENLNYFGHVHPEDFSSEGVTAEMRQSGKYPLEFTFPQAGRYVLALTALASEGVVSEQLTINVAGTPPMGSIEHDLRAKKTFLGFPEEGKDRYVHAVDFEAAETQTPEGYTVTFTAPTIKAGEAVSLNHHFARNDKPVTDLTSILGAPMHFAAVSEDLTVTMHEHGTIPGSEETHASHDAATFGPDVTLEVTFPKPGRYQLIGQAKHEDNIIFTRFMVDVND